MVKQFYQLNILLLLYCLLVDSKILCLHLTTSYHLIIYTVYIILHIYNICVQGVHGVLFNYINYYIYYIVYIINYIVVNLTEQYSMYTLYSIEYTTGVTNLWPAGQMWPFLKICVGLLVSLDHRSKLVNQYQWTEKV